MKQTVKQARKRVRSPSRVISRRAAPRPTVRRGVYTALIYLLIVMLGVAMTTSRAPGAGQSGLITMLVGAGGCVWELAQWARAVRLRQARRVQEQQRAEQKGARAERKMQQRAAHRDRRRTQRQAADKQLQIQQNARQAQSEQTVRDHAQRQARFEAVSRETTRLQALSEAAFRAELPSLFAARGLRLQTDTPPADENAPPDTDDAGANMIFLRSENQAREIARVLHEGLTAMLADVEGLEQVRQQAGADHAYLVGRDGFSLPALRLASRFPLTLVEPQLLAQWRITAKQNEPPACG